MKISNLIPRVIVVGALVLFFFPNPEENLLVYLGVVLVFVALVVFLLVKAKRK
ncbi:MAG: hypothetical protein KKD18_06485 [Nanoarchaeota archaeon]|nr:hypothetical protein [Nanoarchaeota archaeon]MBU0978040.1 hypothetical protein [Nanoarchaeota archaeon]